MKTTQKGFTVIEGLLIVLILSIIGGTGWYVWHSKSSADSAYNSASSLNQASKNTNQAATPSYAKSGQNVIRLPELGVEIIVPDYIKDLYFKASSSQSSMYSAWGNLGTTSLDSSGCTDGTAELGEIGKIDGQYKAGDSKPDFTKQFSTYYVAFTQYNGTYGGADKCDPVSDQLAASLQALKDSLPSMKLIP